MADFDITITDAVEGQLQMKIDWQDTTLFKKAAFWDLQVVYDNGDRDYWLEGEVTIDPGLTAKEDA